jgi:hypothetical protein
MKVMTGSGLAEIASTVMIITMTLRRSKPNVEVIDSTAPYWRQWWHWLR